MASAANFCPCTSKARKRVYLTIVKVSKIHLSNLYQLDQVLSFLRFSFLTLWIMFETNSCPIFIFDHHEIIQTVPSNVTIVNPTINNHEPISGAAIAYLAAKAISIQNIDLANLAVIGMVGDLHDKTISKTFTEILDDSQTTIKKGAGKHSCHSFSSLFIVFNHCHQPSPRFQFSVTRCFFKTNTQIVDFRFYFFHRQPI